MEHISNFIADATLSIPRQAAICEFIQELRAAKGEFPLNPKALETAGFAWDRVLSPIPVGFLECRDDDSLFVTAARAGYIEAAQVWGLWVATTGGHIYRDDEERQEADRYSARRSLPVPVGPGRQALHEFLAERGVNAASLAALGAL